MPGDLSEYNIDETYKGLLHANGTELTNGTQTIIYDGAGNETSLVLGKKEQGLSVYGNISATGTLISNDIITTNISASEIFANTAAKAFVSFIGDTATKQSSYGVENVTRNSAGKYEINFEDTVSNYFNSGTNKGKYNVNLSMRISNPIECIYSCYVYDQDTTYSKCVVHCLKYDTDQTITYFDPKEVYVTIYKD